MKKTLASLMILAMAAALSGCIVEPARGPGWCYYHPVYCARH